MFNALWRYKGLNSSQDDAQICGTGPEGGSISRRNFSRILSSMYAVDYRSGKAIY